MAKKLVSILNINVTGRVNNGWDGYYAIVKYSTAQKDHYVALGIPANATQNEIKSAFYKLSLQYHPDKDASAGAKERFQEISRAYEVLSNYDLRTQYDLRIKAKVKPKTTQTKSRRHVQTEFTIRPPKSGKIYDFDEWTRQHYGTVFEKQKEFQDYYRIGKQLRYDVVNHGGIDGKYAVLLAFGLAIILFVDLPTLFYMLIGEKPPNKAKPYIK